MLRASKAMERQYSRRTTRAVGNGTSSPGIITKPSRRPRFSYVCDIIWVCQHPASAGHAPDCILKVMKDHFFAAPTSKSDRGADNNGQSPLHPVHVSGGGHGPTARFTACAPCRPTAA